MERLAIERDCPSAIESFNMVFLIPTAGLLASNSTQTAAPCHRLLKNASTRQEHGVPNCPEWDSSDPRPLPHRLKDLYLVASCCDGTGENRSKNTTYLLSLVSGPDQGFGGLSALHQLKDIRGAGCPEAFVTFCKKSGGLHHP